MTRLVFAACLVCTASAFGDVAESPVEAWNAGVELYRKGDFTNALGVLRPMMLEKSYGPRAAEIVAKIERERGNAEEAAAAAQIALRAWPDDARANRNFTRAIDGLPEMRKRKRIDAVLKASQGRDPSSIMLEATKSARRLLEETGSYMTNSAERTVALADRYAAEASRLADAWIPVKEAICSAVTNEEQASTIVLQLDGAEAKTRKASSQIGDLDPDAYASVSEAEHDFTRFLKLVIMPPAAIDEDLVAQSNAWQDVVSFNGRPWQQDALDYTREFRRKFPAWAKEYEQRAQSDTNLPPFSAEDQAKVSALSTDLEKLQMGCVGKEADPTDQEKALGIIREIKELLPKESGGGQGQPQSNSQPPPKQDDKNQQNDKDEKPQDGQDQGQDQKQDQDPKQDNQGDEDEKSGEQGEEESKDDQEIEAMLRKAQERNDEHEADKKARMRKAPLPPNERDW